MATSPLTTGTTKGEHYSIDLEYEGPMEEFVQVCFDIFFIANSEVEKHQ